MPKINPTKVASKIYREVLAIQRNERVLIVADFRPANYQVATILGKTISSQGNHFNIVFQKPRAKGQPMDMTVYSALLQKPNVLISLGRIGNDPFMGKKVYRHNGRTFENYFYYLIDGGISRGAYGFTDTAEEYWNLIDLDYSKMHRLANILKKHLDKAEAVIIKDPPTGTECHFEIRRHRAWLDDAFYHQPGHSGNLPAGEVFITPDRHTGEGTIFVRGSGQLIKLTRRLATPMKLRVKNNLAVDFVGPTAHQLERDLAGIANDMVKKTRTGKLSKQKMSEYQHNIYHVGEIGFGLNPKARIGGKNMLIDEKTYGTVHIALGDDYDGDSPAPIHLDQMIGYPEVYLITNGKRQLILRNKEYLFDL